MEIEQDGHSASCRSCSRTKQGDERQRERAAEQKRGNDGKSEVRLTIFIFLFNPQRDLGGEGSKSNAPVGIPTIEARLPLLLGL